MRTLAELVPLRRPQCESAAEAISALATGEAWFDPKGTAHVAGCLRCQAEVAVYRRVLREMRSMRDQDVCLPPGAIPAALERLHAGLPGGEAPGHAWPGAWPGGGAALAASWPAKAAYVGGITAAGVLVWITRRRPGLPHAS